MLAREETLNHIKGLVNNQGVYEKDPDEVDKIAMDCFSELLTTTRPQRKYEDICKHHGTVTRPTKNVYPCFFVEE